MKYRQNIIKKKSLLLFVVTSFVLVCIITKSSDQRWKSYTRKKTLSILTEALQQKAVQDKRQTILKNFCQNHPKKSNLRFGESFFYSDKNRVIYCRVPKVACTTWKKFMAYFLGYVKSPLNVSLPQLYSLKLKYLSDLQDTPEILNHKRSTYFSFMFSRHPYDRLYSAYRNKFANPHPKSKSYLADLGPQIVANSGISLDLQPTRDDKLFKISFEQFLRFVLQKGPDYDPHWQPQTRICRICHEKFAYLGKFETIQEDSKQILNGLNISIRLPKTSDYAQKSTDLLKLEYEKLPRQLLDEIYNFYKDDFDAFSYDPGQYF